MLTQHPSNSDSLEVRCYLPTSNCSQRRHGPTGVHDRPTGKEFQIFGIMDVLEKGWTRFENHLYHRSAEVQQACAAWFCTLGAIQIAALWTMLLTATGTPREGKQKTRPKHSING